MSTDHATQAALMQRSTPIPVLMRLQADHNEPDSPVTVVLDVDWELVDDQVEDFVTAFTGITSSDTSPQAHYRSVQIRHWLRQLKTGVWKISNQSLDISDGTSRLQLVVECPIPPDGPYHTTETAMSRSPIEIADEEDITWEICRSCFYEHVKGEPCGEPCV